MASPRSDWETDPGQTIALMSSIRLTAPRTATRNQPADLEPVVARDPVHRVRRRHPQRQHGETPTDAADQDAERDAGEDDHPEPFEELRRCPLLELKGGIGWHRWGCRGQGCDRYRHRRHPVRRDR